MKKNLYVYIKNKKEYGRVIVMSYSSGYFMLRRKGAMPFIVSINDIAGLTID